MSRYWYQKNLDPPTIGQNVEIFAPLPSINSKQRLQARREGRDLHFGETNSSPQRLTASERVRQYIQQPDPAAISARNLASSPPRSTGPSPSMTEIFEQNRRRSPSKEQHNSHVKRPRSMERDDNDVAPIKRGRGHPSKDEELNVNSNNRSPRDVPAYRQLQNTSPRTSRNGRLRSTEPHSYYESPERNVHRGRKSNQDRLYLEGTHNYGNGSSTNRRSAEPLPPLNYRNGSSTNRRSAEPLPPLNYRNGSSTNRRSIEPLSGWRNSNPSQMPNQDRSFGADTRNYGYDSSTNRPSVQPLTGWRRIEPTQMPNQDLSFGTGTHNYGNGSSTSRRSVQPSPQRGWERRSENAPNQSYYNRSQRSGGHNRRGYYHSASKGYQNRGQHSSSFNSNSRRSMERSPPVYQRRIPDRENTSNSHGRRSVDRQQQPASRQPPGSPRQQQAPPAASYDHDINHPEPPPTPREKQNVPQTNPGALKGIFGAICLGLTVEELYGDHEASSNLFAPNIFIPDRIGSCYNLEASSVHSIVESFDKLDKER